MAEILCPKCGNLAVVTNTRLGTMKCLTCEKFVQFCTCMHKDTARSLGKHLKAYFLKQGGNSQDGGKK